MKTSRIIKLNDKPFKVYLDEMDYENFCTVNRNAGIDVKEVEFWDKTACQLAWVAYCLFLKRVKPTAADIVDFFYDHAVYIQDKHLQTFEDIIIKRVLIPQLVIADLSNAARLPFAEQFLDTTVSPNDYNHVAYYVQARINYLERWFNRTDAEIIIAREIATFREAKKQQMP